jgi:DNA topoisomerase-1
MLVVDPTKFPIRRQIQESQAVYVWSERNETVAETRLVARLNALAVPPAWDPAFFAASGRSKVQAMAIDGSGKEQAIYASWFRQKRETDKFSDLWAFGATLPTIRRRAVMALRSDQCDAFAKAVAACVLAIDEGALRVGSRTYRQANGTVGAVSLQGRHVEVSGRAVNLHFTAKGGKQRFVRLRQPDLVEHLIARQPKAHEDVFSVPSALGSRHGLRKVRGRHVRQWLVDHAVEPDEADLRLNPFTAKSFRLWHASAEAFATDQHADGRTTIKAMSQSAANRLGNTPTVARTSYIHPDMFDAKLTKKRHLAWASARARPFLSKADAALLALLAP